MALYSLGDLEKIVTAVFVNSKSSSVNAGLVARALIKAEADGLASHGLARVASYANQSISGKVNGFAEPKMIQGGLCSGYVNAFNGFAYPAIDLGLEWSLKKIDTAGIVGVGISNSHHSGVMGHHVEKIAMAGFIGIGFTNSPSALGPWGGDKAIFGTNPIAFSCPRKGFDPIVIDLSMSKAARGKIMVAAEKGDAIPEGWALDQSGQPTTDPKAALAGTMLPMGEAKGAALTLMIEILTASLTGSNYGFEASSFFSPEGPPPSIGQTFIIIDAKAFGGSDFDSRIGVLMNEILKQPGVRLPGQKRFKARKKSYEEGVEVAESLIVNFQERISKEI